MNKYIFNSLLDYCNSYKVLIILKHTSKHYYRLINNLQTSNIFKNISVPDREIKKYIVCYSIFYEILNC